MKTIACFVTLFGLFLAGNSNAETVVAAHTIRAQQIITASDVEVIPDTVTGATNSLGEVTGYETRRTIYAGRPILLSDIGPVALVDRNQVVPLSFRVNGLLITTEGRALDRGGYGDRVKVLNLASRTTVLGKVDAHGTVWAKQ